jgi:histidinol-phosphate phosphatase family protein
MSHPHLAREFGHQALRRARALYTWRRVSDAIESLYAEVLDRPARSSRAAIVRERDKPLADDFGTDNNRAVFLDKDGTLIEDIPYNVDPEKIRLAPGAAEGLAMLHESGYRLVVVSNQSGVARGHFAEQALAGVERSLRRLLEAFGVPLDGFYYCPHHPDGTVAPYAVECSCRKPAPGMLRRAAAELRLDLSESWMIGDILDDVECGRRAGCRTVLIDNGNETKWKSGRRRRPHHVVADLAEAARRIVAAPLLALGGRS